MTSPSNPVAPTIDFVPIGKASGAEPVGDPVAPNATTAPDMERVSVALATAAQALLAVVEMLRGAPPSSVRTCPDTLQHSPFLALVDAPSVVEVVNELLVRKAHAGKSDRYLRQLRVSLSSFSRGKSALPISRVTVQDVERWLFNRGWKARTMKGYLGDVRTLFNFAVKRGYVKTSVAAAVELPSGNDSLAKAPAILSVRDVAKILTTAAHSDRDVLRHLAIRIFTGVRSAEAHRLREENILPTGYVEIPAVKAKTRRRRLVKIHPTLRAWLDLGGALRPLHPSTVRRVVKASGVVLPANGTRHSFCSYHLAQWQSAAKTALEAGHTEAMLFAHYRELVTEADAAQFWNLTPDSARELLGKSR